MYYVDILHSQLGILSQLMRNRVHDLYYRQAIYVFFDNLYLNTLKTHDIYITYDKIA